MLFDEIIFGPITSRRLGQSLGINLLPTNGKVCTFDCIYCECGFNFRNPEAHMPSRNQVKEAMQKRFDALAAQGATIDSITFAGNGEPTVHPDFETIIDDTIALRNSLFPQAKISVLSNATCSGREKVFRALNRVDNAILKLDSGIEASVRLINQPCGAFSLDETVRNMCRYRNNLIIQTLFFSGEYGGHYVDNTTTEEVEAWLQLIAVIRPQEVMLYSLDRPAPAQNLKKASLDTLKAIAGKVEALGIATQVNG
ncbi:MAG: radical SAM protein [Prevotellaceae bacterium]|jgi:wyosine [tRNA(Phe)-imidazoG37] synthetase (radical SAM superfamily)|nr:radical SAM protein [Prevotellaceae bacterium]